ncbi:MAG TPA: alkaline phosphatase D family protein [Solirubrobacteraceae bacterium]|nr:alkaline phosphatase D family protein [Solirubrobacteraceae bacterium]
MSARRPHLTRRELVASATAAGALAAVPPAWGRKLLSRRPRVGPGTFDFGVASGEPTATAVTFWSKLETLRPRSGARLVVARDQGLRRVVATAIVPTGAGVNGALKARIGNLKPGTEYFYVWESGTEVSEIGRTRTAPDPRAAEPLRLAYSSCQHWPSGFYGAHQHAAGLSDVDLYLFLGDYVYERAGADVRRDPIDAVDLRSYRQKYGLYRSDPGLRELHRLHPTAHVWDDHEVVNNYTDNNPPTALAQRMAAYRAAFEWLPRMTFPRERHRIYKKLELGALADVFLLDERQYRTGRNDGLPRSMLGPGQLEWLLAELRASRATWKIVANQVVMAARQEGEERASGDSWDGYPEDRARLLATIEREGIDNVVLLTGDAHVFMTNLLASDFEALAAAPSRKPAAVEYVGGSVSSPGPNLPETEVRDRAPWVQQYDGGRNGYAQFDVAPDRLDMVYLSVPVFSADPAATIFERFVQPAGENRVQRTSGAAARRRV